MQSNKVFKTITPDKTTIDHSSTNLLKIFEQIVLQITKPMKAEQYSLKKNYSGQKEH